MSAQLLDADGDERAQFAAGEPADRPAAHRRRARRRARRGLDRAPRRRRRSCSGRRRSRHGEPRLGRRSRRAASCASSSTALPLADGRFHLRFALIDAARASCCTRSRTAPLLRLPGRRRTGAVLLDGDWSLQETPPSRQLGGRELPSLSRLAAADGDRARPPVPPLHPCAEAQLPTDAFVQLDGVDLDDGRDLLRPRHARLQPRAHSPRLVEALHETHWFDLREWVARGPRAPLWSGVVAALTAGPTGVTSGSPRSSASTGRRRGGSWRAGRDVACRVRRRTTFGRSISSAGTRGSSRKTSRPAVDPSRDELAHERRPRPPARRARCSRGWRRRGGATGASRRGGRPSPGSAACGASRCRPPAGGRRAPATRGRPRPRAAPASCRGRARSNARALRATADPMRPSPTIPSVAPLTSPAEVADVRPAVCQRPLRTCRSPGDDAAARRQDEREGEVCGRRVEDARCVRHCDAAPMRRADVDAVVADAEVRDQSQTGEQVELSVGHLLVGDDECRDVRPRREGAGRRQELDVFELAPCRPRNRPRREHLHGAAPRRAAACSTIVAAVAQHAARSRRRAACSRSPRTECASVEHVDVARRPRSPRARAPS